MVDSDDYVDTYFLEKMYKKAKEEESDIVVCDTINVYSDGKIENIKSNLHFSNNEKKNYLLSPSTGCIRLYKKTLFNNNKFKKGILYEDLELTPGLVNECNKISFIEEGLYYYLQRDGSIMKQQKFNDKFLDIFYVLEANREKLKNYPDELEYLYITHLLRSATLRFLNYNDANKYLNKINKIMHDQFPDWMDNVYYKKSSRKLQLVCKLAYKKHYTILKLLKKITNK